MPIMNNWKFDGKAESLLRKLVGVEAPSGDESRMGGFLRNLLETMPGVTVSTDVLGNVYASYDTGGAVSLGLVAHIDSVGIQITRVDSDGMCRFQDGRRIASPCAFRSTSQNSYPVRYC